MDLKQKKGIMAGCMAILILLAALSFFIIAPQASKAENHQTAITNLQDKKETVMELTVASTAVSTALTLIPGDVATPVAEKIADLSGWFLVIVTAIYIEIFLATITGAIAFRCLVPLSLLALAVNIYLKNEIVRNIAVKVLAFGLAIFLVIPATIHVSGLIEDTYGEMISNTITTAQETSESIEKDSDDSVWEKLTGNVTQATDKAKNCLSNFVDAIAVLIITACVVPLAILFFFIWIIKMMLGIQIRIPSGGSVSKAIRRQTKELIAKE